MTTIAALPTPPSRTDPTNFASRADAFLTALPTFGTETNAVAGEVNAAKLAAEAAKLAAEAAKTGAETAEDNAEAAKLAAAAAAASAANAPGTSATSTSAVTIQPGAAVFTIQPGKAYAVGQRVVITKATDTTRFMYGQITAHNSGTGALSVTVDLISASGGGESAANWVIALSGPLGIAAVVPSIMLINMGVI